MTSTTKIAIAVASLIALAVLVYINRPASSVNVALGGTVTASSTYESSSPANVVDGDPSTLWNAGQGAPAWIEIDLGASCRIDRATLIVEQTPEGPTVHNVSFGTEAREFSPIEVLSQQTADGQALTCGADSARDGVRFVRVETTSSPSWVAWKEIEVWGACD